ncbi:Regulator of telomere elongation helicase 1 [Monoraphidium neglectum]|uniref:Regulator of telomere elongation helicase 1 n=1 Tax=Monoraphidium neglectum TaxID=145388 RepID=A0A0D2LMT3_9CHLO|nr:Regulator of telomere elongation helicase 1 [Monoraphidium neglectum]KIY93099.1 Regulator of telomere elongation helicase 1 [Monoraphidium neglectum]|eukprot:XP_013892119.1 Regulator of telomere elongation helicase 1 [Monoraphidium neglectum]
MLKQASQVLCDEELANGRTGGAKMASSGWVGRGGAGAYACADCLDALLEALTAAFASREPLWRDGPPASRGYRLFVHKERVQSYNGLVEAPTLSYWCFVPGVALHRLLARRVRSLLLTSGTLSPLDSFAAELQLGFKHTLENPHIVEQHQVWVGVVPSGPTGASLNSSYASRSTQRYRDDLGNALVNFARAVPDGLLVFFPAYSVMTSCLEHWKAPPALGGASVWERICRYKAPVVEPREAASFPAAILDYKAKLDDPALGGAVFFAVCRGKVSEGIDFSDRAGRGVVVTGIPFSATHDPAVRLQRQVLDDELRSGPSGLTRGKGVSGEQWYVQQAARAVNQAMGRIIRHRWGLRGEGDGCAGAHGGVRTAW